MRGIVTFIVVCSIGVIAHDIVLNRDWVQSPDPLEVVCTTTHLSSIVDTVGGDKFKTHTIIPFGMCPGHFDLSPGEARKLLEAPLLLHHGYERFLKDIDFGDRNNQVQVDIAGNWMIPDVQVEAVWEITHVLSRKRPDDTDEFTTRAREYVSAITALIDSLTTLLSAVNGVPVISAGMNRDFVEWIGLDVLSDYPRDEDISIALMHRLITDGRTHGVKCVIDNKQSSGKIGQTIADNLDVPLIIMTNFPDAGSGSAYPYLEALKSNCNMLLSTVHDDKYTRSDSGS